MRLLRQEGKHTIIDRNVLYGVIQKQLGEQYAKRRVQNDLPPSTLAAAAAYE
jgi:hypothetical protein